MIPTDRLSIAGPESRGAALLPEAELRHFLERATEAASKRHGLCGLVLVKLIDARGAAVGQDHHDQAAQMVSQLMRQADAVGVIDPPLLAIVLHALDRRGDAYIMLDRLEAFGRSAGLPWSLAMGVAVYPLSAPSHEDLWVSCQGDLQGAMSSNSWEHLIPRDTLLTRSAG